MDPNEISSALSNVFNVGLMNKLLVWTGYILIAVLILAAFVVIYYWFTYKYKVVYPVLHYDKDGKYASILRFKKDRARVFKKNGVPKTHFLFARKYAEPLKKEHIKPGNRVFLFSINEDQTYTPLPALMFDSPTQFEYLTPEEKTWAILELKETASANEMPELAKRMLFYMVITVAFCLVAAIVAVWLIMRSPSQVADALNTLGPSLQNYASGVVPR